MGCAGGLGRNHFSASFRNSARSNSGELPYLIVTVIDAEVLELPATSVATAVSVCVPFATGCVFQVVWYGLAVSVANLLVVPSR